MKRKKPQTTMPEEVIRLMQKESDERSRTMTEKLDEAIDSLRKNDRFGAFRALAAMDGEFHNLSAMLKLAAMSTVRNTADSSDAENSSDQPEPIPQLAATHTTKQRKKT